MAVKGVNGSESRRSDKGESGAIQSKQSTGGRGGCIGACGGRGGLGGHLSLLSGQRWRCLSYMRGCVCLLTQESEPLRLMAFDIYGALLAKVKRTALVFPLKHQVLNLIVLLVLHLEDTNINVAQVRGQAVEPGLPAPVVRGGK